MILQICNSLDNVGDLLAPIITERITNKEVIPIFKTIPDEYCGSRILAGLGSFLGYYGDWPLSIWGTGLEPGYMDRNARENLGSRKSWEYFALRGHLTKTVFGVKNKVVIGDSALVMPVLYNPTALNENPRRYFRHFSNNSNPKINAHFQIHHTRMNPFEAIDLITNSKFVFTEALHIAILAQAYGVPWAWSLNKHKRAMFKWFDWFSSLNIASQWFPPQDSSQAERWYMRNYRDFSKINPQDLLNAFPEEFLR
jgi:hypothetical protein